MATLFLAFHTQTKISICMIEESGII